MLLFSVRLLSFFSWMSLSYGNQIIALQNKSRECFLYTMGIFLCKILKRWFYHLEFLIPSVNSTKNSSINVFYKIGLFLYPLKKKTWGIKRDQLYEMGLSTEAQWRLVFYGNEKSLSPILTRLLSVERSSKHQPYNICSQSLRTNPFIYCFSVYVFLAVTNIANEGKYPFLII